MVTGERHHIARKISNQSGALQMGMTSNQMAVIEELR
jgi:hypothetical protein